MCAQSLFSVCGIDARALCFQCLESGNRLLFGLTQQHRCKPKAGWRLDTWHVLKILSILKIYLLYSVHLIKMKQCNIYQHKKRFNYQHKKRFNVLQGNWFRCLAQMLWPNSALFYLNALLMQDVNYEQNMQMPNTVEMTVFMISWSERTLDHVLDSVQWLFLFCFLFFQLIQFSCKILSFVYCTIFSTVFCQMGFSLKEMFCVPQGTS